MSNTIYGDNIGEDKIGRDKVYGDKIVNIGGTAENQISLEDALIQLSQLPTDAVPDPQNLPPNSRMPYSPNPKFTGRLSDFKKLAQTLKGVGQAAVINTPTAITGLGGVGKTQLAAEFAHRYGRYFLGGVYWLSFADPDAIPAEIAACGRRMNLPNLDAIPLAQQVEKIVGKWEKPIPRLLIFDNCEREELFEEYRPKSGGSRVLVTSRRGRWSPAFGLSTLPLGLLSRDESIHLLQQFWSLLTDEEAGALAEVLGDLPLALHLAGSYLNYYEGAVSAAEFLTELTKDGPFHESLSGKIEGHTPTRYERNVACTFELSYKQLDSRDLACQILKRLVHLAPGEPVPDSLLKATFGEEGERPNDKDFVVARQQLVKLGLVSVDGEGAIRLHRLVALYVGRVVGKDSFEAAMLDVEKGVYKEANQLIKVGHPGPLLAWQNHLRFVANKAISRSSEWSSYLANEMGHHLWMVADYAGAENFLTSALKIREQMLGSNHPDTAQSLNNLGVLMRTVGNLERVLKVMLTKKLDPNARIIG